MFLRIRKSPAAVRRWEPANTRYRFYICQSERKGARVTRRDLAYAGAITDKDMKNCPRNVERVYRDIEAALTKIGATDVDRSKILISMAEWCPRPNADALAVEARQRAEGRRVLWTNEKPKCLDSDFPLRDSKKNSLMELTFLSSGCGTQKEERIWNG